MTEMGQLIAEVKMIRKELHVANRLKAIYIDWTVDDNGNGLSQSGHDLIDKLIAEDD